MSKYNKTRNRKRKKTKQINKRTRKQSVGGKTKKYKRSRQLGGADLSGSTGFVLNGLRECLFAKDIYGNVMIKYRTRNLWRLFLSAIPTTHPQNLKLDTNVDRGTLIIEGGVRPSEVKIKLDMGDGTEKEIALLLWPLMENLITVGCEDQGVAIRTINDIRKENLREVIERISKGQLATEIKPVEATQPAPAVGAAGEGEEVTPLATAEEAAGAAVAAGAAAGAEAEAAGAAGAAAAGADQQGGAAPYSRPLSGAAETVTATNTIPISEGKKQDLIDHLLNNYGVKLSPEQIASGGEIDIDDLMQKLGILEEPSYHYGSTPYCDSCPGQYKYYRIHGDQYTFDQVASALNKATDVLHQEYMKSVVSVKNLNVGLQAQADESGEAVTPLFIRKTTEEQKRIKNCEICNNPISDSYVNPLKYRGVWKREYCVQCDYVVCKACCDKDTCNRCDLRMFLS